MIVSDGESIHSLVSLFGESNLELFCKDRHEPCPFSVSLSTILIRPVYGLRDQSKICSKLGKPSSHCSLRNHVPLNDAGTIEKVLEIVSLNLNSYKMNCRKFYFSIIMSTL